MTLAEYTTACLKFAKESADWGDLDPRKWYYANNAGDLVEDYDHNQPGIDVSWAFHSDPMHIVDNAVTRFLYYLVNQLEQGLDEGFDTDQWRSLAETYT